MGTVLLYFDYGNLSTVFFVLAILSVWRYYIDNNEKWKKKEYIFLEDAEEKLMKANI